MSFTNTKYDGCAYQKDLTQSTGVLEHVIEKNRFVNANACRVEHQGILQGNPVTTQSFNAKNTQVDIENDLFGLNRQLTRCPDNKNKFCKQADKNVMLKILTKLAQHHLLTINQKLTLDNVMSKNVFKLEIILNCLFKKCYSTITKVIVISIYLY